MWIHEGFTTYMEALFVEYYFGREAVGRYLASQRRYIRNTQPVQGPKDVNFEKFGGSDHYYKGSHMLHTIRSSINDDEVWWGLLRALYDEFKLSNVESQEIISYFSEYCVSDFDKIFDQYLNYGPLPVLEYKLKSRGSNLIVCYRWNSPVKGFNMPIEIGSAINPVRLECSTEWADIKLKNLNEDSFWINDFDFLIETSKVE